jgi:putative transposase
VGAMRRNVRDGFSSKRVLTESDKLELNIPRDRDGTFELQLIAKYQRRFPDFDDKVISMYARGMSVREIQGHLQELYGLEVSPELVSTVTEAVLEADSERQNSPLEPP